MITSTGFKQDEHMKARRAQFPIVIYQNPENII